MNTELVMGAPGVLELLILLPLGLLSIAVPLVIAVLTVLIYVKVTRIEKLLDQGK